MQNSKKKTFRPRSGYKLADVMPQELLNIGYAYRRKEQKRAKMAGLNNFKKGDQSNVRRHTDARAS